MKLVTHYVTNLKCNRIWCNPVFLHNSGGNSGGNVAVIQLTERQRKIYHLIAARADITAKQMAVILDIPTRTLERELASLQSRCVIRHEGKPKTGRWVVLVKL